MSSAELLSDVVGSGMPAPGGAPIDPIRPKILDDHNIDGFQEIIDPNDPKGKVRVLIICAENALGQIMADPDYAGAVENVE